MIVRWSLLLLLLTLLWLFDVNEEDVCPFAERLTSKPHEPIVADDDWWITPLLVPKANRDGDDERGRYQRWSSRAPPPPSSSSSWEPIKRFWSGIVDVAATGMPGLYDLDGRTDQTSADKSMQISERKRLTTRADISTCFVSFSTIENEHRFRCVFSSRVCARALSLSFRLDVASSSMKRIEE